MIANFHQSINVYNLCTEKYYCYAIGTEPVEKVNIINIKDVVGDLNE